MLEPDMAKSMVLADPIVEHTAAVQVAKLVHNGAAVTGLNSVGTKKVEDLPLRFQSDCAYFVSVDRAAFVWLDSVVNGQPFERHKLFAL